MCFSGGFALGMMVDDIMVAPVLSQPSMPFPFGKARAADLNLSPDDAATVAERAAQGCQVLGLRYTDDFSSVTGSRRCAICSATRSSRWNCPSRTKRDHSVLTEQRDDASVERVLDFFAEKLLL